MNHASKIVGSTILGIVVLCVIAVIFVRNLPDVQEVTEFGNRFQGIKNGDQESRVIAVLGKPNAKEMEFRLGQEQGFEDAYARAKASESSYYLLWYKGIDVIFTVGINAKGLVSVKESGGT